MATSQVGHKYAVVKLYPGLDEALFGKLLNGLGLEVVFTNDVSDCHQAEEAVTSSSIEVPADIPALIEPPVIPAWNNELAIREWMALIEYIETNVNVELIASTPEPSSNDASVQTSELEATDSNVKENVPKTMPCMICQEEVPRDKKSLRAHVQIHSGKRYGCSRCKYHTDRKFDFTRHIRRRHEGKPDPQDGGSRPHWMSLLRSCFPNYSEVMRFRRPKRAKPGHDSSEKQLGNCAQQQSSESPFAAKPSTADIPPVVC
ncbi:C2H2-type domain-containing protein [Trichostrongylus colubriformis]|uniref:C2H2-type domain-containing protein n=1 Tax=Trichostrongylus colubriformis TaxID=6319 RepID=A0AAN8FGF8_TRICO